MRSQWVESRKKDTIKTQLHYAKKGIITEEMEYVAKETNFVAGLRNKSGDPSPMTAYGVYMAMKASALKAFGSDNLGGKKISIQGLGHVGLVLCDYLAKDNAHLFVSDLDSDKVKKAVELYKAK